MGLRTLMEMCGVCRECTWEVVVEQFHPASVSTSSAPKKVPALTGDGTLLSCMLKRKSVSCSS